MSINHEEQARVKRIMSQKDVEAYLAKLSPEKRATLEKVRNAIRTAAPNNAHERISYGMPAFVAGRPIAGYSASANHCSYFPMSGVVTSALQADLEGYETSKGGLRFPIGAPPPATLIRKLVKARLAEIEGGEDALRVFAARARRKKAAKA
jgi:uncharacterized protein YdhG (YjbR/CyaY superfamily)